MSIIQEITLHIYNLLILSLLKSHFNYLFNKLIQSEGDDGLGTDHVLVVKEGGNKFKLNILKSPLNALT